VGQYWSNGTTPKGSVNLSGYEFISFDIWVGQLDVEAIFAMTLLDSDQAGEKLVSTTISTNDTGWKTVTLNMSEWAGQDLTDIKGVKWEPTGTLKLAYIDNFYAWNNPSENTVLNVSVNTNANSNYPNVSNGDAIALNYSTDAGSSYKLSSPLADSDADGIWEGTLALPKDTGAVQYKVAVVNAADGYSSATAQSGNTLASNADFSYTTGQNTVIADLFFLKRDSDADSFATLTSSAKVDVTVIIRGLHPDHTSGQYGVRAPGGGCYGVGDWTSNVDGVFTDTMSLQFYSTLEYEVGFHNATNGWCGDNMVSKNANTNELFSVTVEEAGLTEDLTAIKEVDRNNNFVVYTSVGDLGKFKPVQFNWNNGQDFYGKYIEVYNGATASVVTDPAEVHGNTLEMKYAQDGAWQNVHINIPVSFKSIRINDDQRTVTFDIWSDHGADAGKYGYLLKLENPTDGSGSSIEKSFKLSGSGSWETVTVDFSNCENAPGNCDASNNDKKLINKDFQRMVFFNWGGGDPSAQPDTVYIDNFMYQSGAEVPNPNAATPITTYSEDFADGDSGWAAADGAAFVEADGYGTASKTNAGDWAHVFVNTSGAMDLSGADRGFSVKVKGPRASKVFLKLQEGTNYGNNHEFNPSAANYTTVGEWQTIVFDATSATSTDKTRIVLFFDTQMAASTDPADDIFQIDDFKMDAYAALGLADVNLAEMIVVYPNPSTGMVNISGVDSVDAIRAFTISGQLVKESVNANTLDLSSARKGLYMIEIEHEGQTTVNKLIVR
jgi:hypothetical protein